MMKNEDEPDELQRWEWTGGVAVVDMPEARVPDQNEIAYKRIFSTQKA